MRRAAEEVNGLTEAVSGFGGTSSLCCPTQDSRRLALLQEEFAVPIASDRLENRQFGLPFGLKPLRPA